MAAMHRPVRRDVRLLGAGALAFATIYYAHRGLTVELSGLAALIQSTMRRGGDLVALGYQTAPALTIGLLAALAFPLLAIGAFGARRAQRSRDQTKLYRRSLLTRDAGGDISGDGEGGRGRAFLEVIDGSGVRYAILGDMLRIGREDDNDIRIPSAAVHRYHAAVSREDFDDWRITDLSGLDGNGVLLNGRRCGDAVLEDGDVIQLGPRRLRFRARTA